MSSAVPFFSVVIPLYNKEVSVLKTIKSVLSQDVEYAYEVIVVNDGSTDSSLDVVSEISDSRIKVFDIRNGGVSRARNYGVSKAQGIYIAFLDADDIWHEWHLSELKSLIDRFPGCSLYSVAHEIMRDGVLYEMDNKKYNKYFGVVERFFDAFQCSLSIVNSSTACMPKSVFDELGGFPVGIKKGEDVYMWAKAAIYGGFAYSSRVCALYNQEAENRSSSVPDCNCPYFIVWLDEKKASGNFLGTPHEEDVTRFLIKSIVFNAAGLAMNGNVSAVKSMKELFLVKKNIFLRIYLIVLRFLPPSLLVAARKLRHARRN